MSYQQLIDTVLFRQFAFRPVIANTNHSLHEKRWIQTEVHQLNGKSDTHSNFISTMSSLLEISILPNHNDIPFRVEF